MPTSAANEAAARLGLTIDDVLILNLADTKLLVAAAAGELDLNRLAAEQLASRGLDKAGKWVGFARAAQIHGIA